MPNIHASAAAPWSDGATIHLGSVDLPWGDGATIHAAPSAYTPGAAPGGGTLTGPVAGAATYVIASRPTYDVPHTMVVTDLRDDEVLAVESLSVSIDEDSAMWSLRASGGNSLYTKLTTGNQPAQVSVDLDGELWVFVVDAVSRSRSFGESSVGVSGRSLAVLAGMPYEREQNWVNDGDSTGAQIAATANLYTGLGVSWEIEDWIVPDRVFTFSGPPLSVVSRVAEAVGAVVQADRTELGVRVMPRYPLLPNEWSAVAPDVEIAFDAALSENFERSDRPEYTGVYVSGQILCSLGFVRLAGTSGSYLHPLVTDALLTEEPAWRMRGMSILGASGGQARVTLGLPLLTGAGEPGALSVGQLVRVLDPAGTWHGLVRSVSLSAELPTITQTVVLERHTKDIEGSVAIPSVFDPLVFAGPIGDGTGTEGAAFSLALASFWSGGTTPYAWSLRSGALPAGVTLNASTGVVSGTPTAAGTYSVAFRATDAVFNMADSNTFDVVVSAAAAGYPKDLFTGGSSSLATRTPDVGGSWVEGSAWINWTPAADTVTGGSLNVVAGPDRRFYFINGPAPATEDCYAEIEIYIPASASSGYPIAGILLTDDPDNGSANKAKTTLWRSGSWTVEGGGGSVSGGAYLTDVVKTLRVELTSGRSTLAIYLDGVLKTTSSGGTYFSSPLGAFKFGVIVGGDTAFSILRAESGAL